MKYSLITFFIFINFCVFAQNNYNGFNLGGANLDGQATVYNSRNFLDRQKNLLVCGTYSSSNMDLNPGTGIFNISSNGLDDGFLAKYNGAGVLQWGLSLGSTENDGIFDVATDTFNNIYITGYYEGTVDFDPSATVYNLTSAAASGANPGFGGDIFVAKYTSTGALIWAFGIGGGTYIDLGIGIKVSNTGSVYITGNFNTATGVIDFDPGVGINNLSGIDGYGFLAKYNNNGTFAWAFNYGGANLNTSGQTIELTPNNEVYVMGSLLGTGDFDPGPGVFNLTGTNNVPFIAKYDSNKILINAFIIACNTVGIVVSSDTTNTSIYTTGWISGSNIDFDPGVANTSNSSFGSNDIFIAKYTHAGNFVWGKIIGGSNSDIGYGIDVFDNYIYNTGLFTGTVDFDPGPAVANITSYGAEDGYVLRLDTNGNYDCAYNIGGSGNDEGIFIEAIHQDTFYVSGNFYNTALAGFTGTPLNLTSFGSQDLFFLKSKMTCIGIIDTVTANFIEDVLPCNPLNTVLFNDLSTSNFPLNNWLWDFGDPISGFLNNSFLQNPSHDFTSPGSYTITLICTNSNNTLDTFTKVIFIPGYIPFLSAGNNQTICPGDTVSISASGAVTYTWTPSATLNNNNISNPSAFPTSNTSYTVVGTDNLGCTDISIVTISVLNLIPPIIVASPSNICIGNSSTITVSGGSNYNWNPSTALNTNIGSTVVASPLVNTTFTVTAIDNNGCTVTNSVLINVFQLPIVSLNALPQTICNGDSSLLTSSGALTYTWSPSSSLSSSIGVSVFATPSVTTTYTVTGSVALGCSSTSEIQIVVNPNPVFSVVPLPSSICLGDSVILNASGTFNYTWLPAATLNTNTGNLVTASPLVSTTYTVTATSTNGCTATNTALVNLFNLINPTVIASPNSICIGNSSTLTASGASSYSWTPISNLNISTGSTVIATPTINTIYTILGTDANGCSVSNTVLISVYNTPIIIANAAPINICAGSTSTLTASGAISYVWASASTLSSSGGSTVTATPTVTTIYTVTGSNAPNCSSSTTLTLNVFNGPIFTVSPNPISICLGGTATLTANGNYNYNWTPAASLNSSVGSSVLASPTSSTIYTVIAIDSNGCSSMQQATVNIFPTISPIISPTNSICVGDTILIYIVGGNNFTWLPTNEILQVAADTFKFWPTTTTTYTLNYNDINGCLGQTTNTIAVNALPKLLISKSNDIECGKKNVYLNVTGGDNIYNWLPDATLNSITTANPIATPLVTTTYYVTSQLGGCTALDSITVYGNSLWDFEIEVPNAITPNGDGLNDCLKLLVNTNVKNFKLEIFNRWGEKVYNTTNIADCWNGEYKSYDVDVTTVYYYHLTAETVCGTIKKKGDITVLK